jgi:DNA-binding beta-propeller fold protein YncE
MNGFVKSFLTTMMVFAGVASAAEPRFVAAWGKEGTADGEFMFCIGVAIHDQALYVTDHYNNRVQKFDFDGKHLATIPVLPNPGGIAADKDGTLYIVHFPASGRSKEKYEDRVSVYDAEGKFVREFGKTGKGDGELDFAGGVAIGPDNNVYVADQTNRRVMIFTKAGKYVAKFGEYGTGPGQFGGTSNPKSRVGGPQLLAFDHDGNLYTTEGMICRVQKLTKEGKPLAMWGNNKDEPGNFGGKFTGANLEGPIGITVDADNHIWVASLNGRIQQFDTEGKLLGGIQSGQGKEPGKFSAPHGIAINSQGELFVADSYNQRIQKFATK